LKKVFVATALIGALLISYSNARGASEGRPRWSYKKRAACSTLVVAPMLSTLLFIFGADNSGTGYQPMKPPPTLEVPSQSVLPIFAENHIDASFQVGDARGKAPEKAFFNKTLGQRIIATAVNRYVRSQHPAPEKFKNQPVDRHFNLSLIGIQFHRVNDHQAAIILYGKDFRVYVEELVEIDELESGEIITREYSPMGEAPVGKAKANAHVKFHYLPSEGSVWIDEFYGKADIAAFGFHEIDEGTITDVKGTRGKLPELPSLSIGVDGVR